MARGPKPIKRVKSKGNFASSSSSSSKHVRPQKHSADTLAHWETPDDVEQDDEDRFHQQRDKILLDGAGGNDDEDDAFGGGTEVLGLDEEDSEDYDEDEGEGEGYYDEEDEGEDGEEEAAAPRKSKGKTQPTLHAKAAPEDDDGELSSDPEEETGGWGPHKRAYYSTNNVDAMDSDSEMDVEERRQMEVREARKLQAKARQEMGDEDFGLGEELDKTQQGTLAGSGKAARERRRAELDGAADEGSARLAAATPGATAVVQDASAAVAASAPAPPLPVDPRQRAVLLAQVQKTTPETIALAGDYADVVDELGAVTVALKKATLDMPDHPSLGLMHVHHQVLLTYVTTLTFYFHLRSLPEYVAQPEKLASHPVIARLIKLKAGVADMENYGFSAADVFDANKHDAGSEEEMLSGDEDEDEELTGIMGGSDGESESLGSLEQDELDALLADEKENHAASSPRKKAAAAAASSAAAKPKKVKKAKAAPAAPAPLASLASFDMDDSLDDGFGESSSSSGGKSKKKSKQATYDAEAAEGYGELTSLGASDTADKAARRKSLKFHTGQLQAKEARRGEAARQSLGGDADIPYRDRERSRTAVATAAANKAAKAAGLGPGNRDDMELDEEAFGEEDLRDWRDVMGAEGALSGAAGEGEEGEDEDGDYYDLVASRKRAAKKQKRDEYEAIADTERFLADPTLAEGEHRGINRQMEKNRGLTPHRPKSVRNPRVKKRIKFDKAQKKLSSTRAVYKGGMAALEGGYAGEKSGISNVIKSRTFN